MEGRIGLLAMARRADKLARFWGTSLLSVKRSDVALVPITALLMSESTSITGSQSHGESSE